MILSHIYNYMNIIELTTLEKLNNAFYQCTKISAWKETSQRYKANLLVNNIQLQNELRSGKYKVSNTTNFILKERGKVRNINAPAIRDRIVQKILCQYILVPQLNKYLIYDNYASLKDRGTSFARKRIDILLHKYINTYGVDGYILQIDIKKYFNNIDHEILKKLVHDKIKEPKETMDLIDYIIDISSSTNKGLNLGSEAPQILAIFYLCLVDNYIKTVKSIKYYGRYMDDMFIISKDKEELKILLNEIKDKLRELKLEINDNKTHITKLSHGFTFMQIKYNFDHNKIIKRPSHSKIVRERKRLKKYKILYDKKIVSGYHIQNCYKSWRNNILKDCNRVSRTINNMDKLYNQLFPIHEVYHKTTRKEIIKCL